MKKGILFLPLMLVFALFSCEKKTETVVTEDGHSTVETVGFDKERIDSTAEKIEAGAKDAAQKTGEALENAGEKLKQGTKNAGEDIREATDGDGDPNR